MGFELVGLGLQLVLAHQLGHHQTQTHALFSLRAEDVVRNRRLVGVLDTALLEVGAGGFDHAIEFGLHTGLGQVEFCCGHQRVHDGGLVAGQQAELDFALEVFADVRAQACNALVSDAQRLGQGFVDFGQVGGFDLVHGDQEVSLFAGHVFAVVISRETQGEGLAFARLHAAHGVFKFLEHLAFADQELEGFGFAAGEGFAVDLAFKVDGHAVAVLGGAVHGALGEGAALLAQDVDGLVDGGVADFSAELDDFGTGQVAELDFGVHLEKRVKQQLAFRGAFFFADARLAGHAQLGFVGSGRKGLADLVVHHFIVNRVAITLGHHIHGHLARAKTVHLDRAGQALEARVYFGLDRAHGQRQGHFAFELFQRFYGHGHQSSPEICL